MRPQDRDVAYIWDMREAAKDISEFTAGINFDKFSANKVLYRAVERQLEIVGEAARHVSGEYQQKYPDIPWRQIIGLRNILAHEYGEVLLDETA